MASRRPSQASLPVGFAVGDGDARRSGPRKFPLQQIKDRCFVIGYQDERLGSRVADSGRHCIGFMAPP
jgi:hypothetical protein